MQVHLTLDEFNLLRQMAEDEKRLSCGASPSLPRGTTACVPEQWGVGHELLKEFSRNLQLGFDELEDLADSLRSRKTKLIGEIACQTDPVAKSSLERQRLVVEHFLDKVTEACAMV
jgi:hypothetical protein